MDIFFGYNPYVMITIYALLVDGVFHALRARKASSKQVINHDINSNHNSNKMTKFYLDSNDPRSPFYLGNGDN
jgi:hypothetical protein